MIRLPAALTTLLLWFLLLGPAVANDKVYYYSGDTLQSEVVITDATRNVVERTYYAPYGQVLNRALRDGPGYTGHEEDPETSLVYMQQRYFDPESGRFLSNDPVATTDDGGGFNRYAYANDNPYRYIDPTGAEGVGKEWLDYTLASANPMGAEPLSSSDKVEAGEFIGSFIPYLAEGLAFKGFADHPSFLNAGIVAASFIDLGGVAKGIADALKVDKAAAKSVGSASKLAKQLGSEEGVAELLSGGGKAIAGAGTKVHIRDVGRLISEHGGKAEEWVKVTSTAREHLQTHAYRNVVTGETVELKSVVP